MYFGVVSYLRGSANIEGSNDAEFFEGPDIVAMPLKRQLDSEDARDMALMHSLLADVVASGYYTYYEWREEDE
jgi:hypothetical protein